MTGDGVRVSLRIEAGTEAVWHALTVGRSVWWPDMVFEAAAGAPLIETWIEDGERREASGTVTAAERPRLLAFDWRQPEWRGSTHVSIDLAEDGAATEVAITETGFADAGTPAALAAEHADGWRFHLGRLRDACLGEA
ncbi:SRPBCC family protein [Microbacterium sediminis]|uniref:SRPBCC family protein n=1 Tax=Microbacterium sediminis TaxID=904291 RepID=UPI001304001B|nr:SRPBCC domain-containing protein [Microbacterium sediminis]